VTLKGQGREPNMFRAQYLETTGDRESVTMERLHEMLYGASNGHITNDVT